MKAFKIDLNSVGGFSKIFLDYIAQDDKLNSFFKYRPTVDSFEACIKDVSMHPYNRPLLSAVLTEQYDKCRIKHPVAIKLLLKENTFTVCTGHQLCLFTGPLYFIYKIITTINLSEELKKKYPQHNFIPVYWMASEDHDFDEINHIHLFGKKILWNNQQGGVVGKYSTQGIELLIEELKPILGDSENAKQLIELFKNAYINQPNLAQATQSLVHVLFGDYGLLIFDANDVRLKAEFSTIMEDDLLQKSAYSIVGKKIENFEKLNYKALVHPREINLFYNIDNQRERVIEANQLFNILNTSIQFDKTALLAELKVHPERFSPNVILRPLYQQKILPNLAYVGGPGELAYWLEFKALFDYYGVLFPVLIPRNFAMVLDAFSLEKINKFNFNFNELFLPVNKLTEKFIQATSGQVFSLDLEKENIRQMYQALSAKISKADPTLAATVEAEMQNNIKSIDSLEKKVMRSLKTKNETTVVQIEKLKAKLFPNDGLQERYDNFIPFYLTHGKDFISLLKTNFNPFDCRMVVLS